MSPFEYLRAASVDDAVRLLRESPDARALAGGQTLLAAMRLGLATPERLVDLSGVGAMRGIDEEPGGTLRIGALSTHAQVASSEVVRRFAPGLARLAGGIADAQVRTRGTIGGSVANNDPAACWPAGILALGARVITDRREIAADDFFTGVFGTALEPDEVVVAFRVPRPRRFAYAKFEQPASRFALLGVAVAEFDDGTRVSVTGGGDGVFRIAAFEQALAGAFDPAAIPPLPGDDAARMYGDLHASAEYRAHLASVLARRAVEAAASAPASQRA